MTVPLSSPQLIATSIGIPGPPGPQGEVGPAGPQGEVGPAGPSGSISSVTNNILFTPDNTYDIGASGAQRPRNLYLAGTATVPVLNTPLLSPTGNVVEQRNGTSEQSFFIYNSYTDATNYERVRLGFTGNFAFYQTEGNGTGAIRDLYIGTGFGTGNASIRFRTTLNGTATDNWWIPYTGSLIAVTDNAFDIGLNGSNRPRNLYLAGTASIAGVPAFAAGDKYLVIDASGNIHKSAIGPAS